MGLNDDTSLELHYKLDETSGTVLTDATGNTTAALGSTPTDDSQWVTGKFGGGVYRDAAGYVTVNYSAGMSSIPFTIACWVKFAATPASLHSIIAKYTGSTLRHYVIYFDNSPAGTMLFTTKGIGGTRSINSTSAIVVNKWHHICMTCSTTTFKCYFDGVKEGADGDITGDFIGVGNDALKLNSGIVLAGNFDDLRFYSRELSVGEVRQLVYNPYIKTKEKKLRLLGV